MVTNRHPLDEFKLSGLDPFVSEVVTPSDESLYLKGEADDYPTALLDLDGNERASFYLRNSAFNTLHILLKEINRSERESVHSPRGHRGVSSSDRPHRAAWGATIQQLSDELAAIGRLSRSNCARESRPSRRNGRKSSARPGSIKLRAASRSKLDSWREQERIYSAYMRALAKLLRSSPTISIVASSAKS